MNLIECYAGNDKRYHYYLNGMCDFFYIQDSEDKYDIEVCETPEQNSFQTIYNVSVKEEQLQYGCLYKIVDAFVYTSPMITFETFVMNEHYCHPHKFEPLCCLETWKDINTNDIEVLHKRTKDLGVYEIKLSRCMYEINELKHQIDLLTYKKNQPYYEIFKEYTEEQFMSFMRNIELCGLLFLVAGLILKIFLFYIWFD